MCEHCEKRLIDNNKETNYVCGGWLYIDGRKRFLIKYCPWCGRVSRGKGRKTLLSQVRKNRGLRQIDLARKIGVHQSVISELENSWQKPDEYLKNQIVKALDWKNNPDDLFKTK